MHPTTRTSLFRRQFGLRLQLLVAFGVLSLLVASVAGIALWGLLSVRDSARQAVVVDSHLSQLASDVVLQALQSRRYEKDFFMNVEDTYRRADYLQKWKTASAGLDNAIGAFEAAAAEAGFAEDQQQAARWRDQAAHYNEDFGQIERAVMDGHITSTVAANAAFTPFKLNIQDLTEWSLVVAERKAATARETSAAMEATGARTIWLVGLLAVVAIVIAIFWSLLFATRLLRPVLALQTATSRVAGGDLDARVNLVRSDEFGLLASSFNQMTDTISAQIAEQQRANEELRAASATRIAKEYLEEVVRAYSLFASEVAQGNLTARLAIKEPRPPWSRR